MGRAKKSLSIKKFEIVNLKFSMKLFTNFRFSLSRGGLCVSEYRNIWILTKFELTKRLIEQTVTQKSRVKSKNRPESKN